MPLPNWLARINRRVTNPVARLVAGWVPGLAIVTHTGRVSGREYRTPVNIFRSGEQYVFALTYGPERDWVKNVRAATRCRIRTRGRDLALTSPEMVHDPARDLVPKPVRWILGLLHVEDFLHLSVDPGG